jgi:hypothetical protein
VSEILEHGGMGVVYNGRQPFLDRPVAIMLIGPDLDDADAQHRFRLRFSPNLIPTGG